MSTKVIMMLRAGAMALAGLILICRQKVLGYLSAGNSRNLPPVLLQVVGVLYFAFAMIIGRLKAT